MNDLQCKKKNQDLHQAINSKTEIFKLHKQTEVKCTQTSLGIFSQLRYKYIFLIKMKNVNVSFMFLYISTFFSFKSSFQNLTCFSFTHLFFTYRLFQLQTFGPVLAQEAGLTWRPYQNSFMDMLPS